MTSSNPARDERHGQVLGLAAAGLGALTVLRARSLASTLAQQGERPPSTFIVRVLGARQLVQGVLTVASPSESTLLLGAGVDALHALSMVPFIAFSSRLRRPAAMSASLAAASAAAGAALATS